MSDTHAGVTDHPATVPGVAAASAADSATVLTALRAVLPTLRERAAGTEQARRIPVESIDELTDTGILRLLQPRRHGGYETHPAEFYTAVAEVAEACGSTGWVAAVLGISPWNLALFDAAAQDEVWGSDRDARLCSSYALTGTATPVEGGYRLSGRWGFASGCDHAQWALLGARVMDGDTAADSCTFLVPAADYTVVDVWQAVGLRGTGSNDIVVDDVFVPAYRVLDSGSVGTCETPGNAVNDGPLYRIPFGCVHTSAITAAIIGMARGGYHAHLDQQRDRIRVALPGDATKDSGFTGSAFREDPATLTRIAEAAGELDAAWVLLTHNIDRLYHLATTGAPIPPPERLRLRRDQVRGTERAVYAMDRLFENSGGRALRPDSVIQRCWRDAHAGRAHAANDPERVYRMFGSAELGAARPAPTAVSSADAASGAKARRS
ncbi:flavin-dependent monooxygenase [Nocardia sp. BSTN01]|uniref:3-hydroxy-9,10-secoandrosta-1,3,5(10)-triene-9, 17-dione monooxygenase oxygenase subunit n=1 Tax=Nocardia sp. BSTN01 TaxID=2783665 RepID=UPI00188EC9B0|nr:3-hydroxy-9,10-secoandrosta-1,3,5(10)-triene-9,17-dione monooxygenase oxygenase subunit [Nocardia sp. BSTN01]MBF5000667.1 flavin-dependent monooxygenase [Nocardia sp. BSTN01]